MKIKQLQEQIASREHVYRAVYQNKVVSINSFTLSEIASYSEHEWLFSDGSCLPSNDVEEGDLVYLQRTGLVDKNGVRIFVGDICRVDHLDKRYKPSYEVITYNDKDACIEVGCGLANETHRSHEVIGNIFEDEDLLP